ncbi:MAG: Glu/Leu/Phe/Val dehydrogenase dimerization domain-containing protein [Nitrospirota bacterium]
MDIFREMNAKGHERLLFWNDPDAGLNAIIAIHNTTLGPALGGCRIWPYNNTQEAIKDVLRLSRAMTYKASVCGINLGGGKSVIIGSQPKNREAVFRSFGRFVESLEGIYITAEDVGTSVSDMEIVKLQTSHVAGVSKEKGGSGDPSIATAIGVYWGIKACLKNTSGGESVAGKTVAIQGIGKVGFYLAEILSKEGAKVFLTDIDRSRTEDIIKRFGGDYIPPKDIFSVSTDIFCPCALGGILNDETIPLLKCRIVAGSANNQLEDESHGRMLHERGILYAPDFVINAGGLINVANEIEGYDKDKALSQVKSIYDTLLNIFRISTVESIPTNMAADRMAEDRIRRKKASTGGS